MYLGLDIGTSAVKAICSDGMSILATASHGLSSQSPKSGWSEQHPQDWWLAVRHVIQGLGGQIALADVKAIGLSGQMHGAVILDKNLRVIRPAILWNDSRAVTECDMLRKAVPTIGKLSGVLPLPGFTAPKLTWLARNEPAAFAEIAHVLLPKDYIGLRLHGACASDRSDAAGTLWLDQSERAWSAEVATATQTDMAWLPALFDGHEIVGEITAQAASETGLQPGTPVVAGGGDAATGAVSLGATEPCRGFISLGTSGQLFVADNTYRPNPDRYVHAFAHTVPDRWYQMAAMLNGARPISWIGDQLNLSASQVVELAETADGERIPIFLPYLTGERSPHGDPHIRACFFGLEDSTTRAEICRAVTEAVAFCFADSAQSFGDVMDTIPDLAAIGGGSQSDLVLSLIASVTGKPIHRSGESATGPAFGAARLAACGCGALAVSDLGARAMGSERFEPSPRPALQDRLHKYRRLYGAIRDLQHTV